VILGIVVQLIRTIMALTVLAAWLPATSHCLLAGADSVSVNCQEKHHHGDAPSHSHDDCGVCVLETGGFKLADQEVFHFAFASILSWHLVRPPSPHATLEATFCDPGRAPPDLKRAQFRTRTAVPGRAPAIL
jgi:hypothetical protein